MKNLTFLSNLLRKLSAKTLVQFSAVLILLCTLGTTNVWGTTFMTTTSGGFSGTNKSKTTDGITVTFSSDASWQSGHVRVYQSGTISFSCSSNITAITINCTSTSDYPARTFNASTGSCAVEGSAITWSGSGTSITLTLPSGKQVRITSIVVTTGSSCSSPPTVGASGNSSISVTGATVSCTGITKGDCDIDEWGFFYKTGSSGVTTSDTKVQVSAAKSTTNVSSFNKSFTELNPNTHYYFKAYAKVGSNYYLSSETDFTTKTLTSTSSNTTYGTVSRSGRVITGSLKSGGAYGSPAYTVTGASDGSTTTVERAGNTFTVTSNSTSNITVRINFEAKGCEDHGASSITGGTSTGTTYGPVSNYYNYGARQILYTKEDLGLAAGKKGTIKSIYFEYAYTSAITNKDKIKIYMANTTLETLSTSSYVPYASFTEVYSGDMNFTVNGWNEISITNFEYDGVGNLAVLITDNSGKYDGSSYVFKYKDAPFSGAQIYKNLDGSFPDPSSDGTWADYATASRPNTKFCIQEADMVPATVTLKDNDATLTEASAGAGVTLPSRTGCSGYTFAGWTKSWVAEQSSWTTTAPTIIPAGSYTPAADENLYPVYTKTESGGGPSNDYELYSGSITEGDYIIYYDGKAMNTTVSSDRLQYEEVTPDDDVITTTDESIIWHVAASGDYWTIYNANADAYAASTGAKNKAQMLADGTDDKSLWTVSGTSTYEFVNKQNTANSVNANLRNNGTYGFACYATSTGGALSLYKNVSGGSTTSYISVPACCTDWSTPTVSYSSSLAINASEGVTIGSGTTHGAVTYESSDEDVLTVDADGTIHAVGAGTAHIVATWAGNATYCQKSANSNDITVSGIQVTGTTPVNFGQVYQNAVVANKTIYVTGLGLASAIMPSLPVGSPFSFSPASLAANSSGATLTISANTATLGNYNQTLTLTSGAFSATVTVKMEVIAMPTATFTDALHGLTEDEDGVSLSSYNLTAAQGTAVVFPTLADQTKSAGTCEGEYYIFVGWTEGNNNTDPEDHLVTSYTLANGDTKNYYAVWADASGSATYTKLTSNSFSGSPAKYVLGAEHEGTTYYFSDYDPDNIAYNLSWGTCSSSDAPIQFTLSGTASALVAKDNLNNYLEAPCTTKAFYISGSETSVELKSNGTIYNNGDGCTSYCLRYNYNSGSGGLRWYTSDTGDPAYFYLVGAAGTVHYRTSCCANKVDAPVVTATAVTSTSITLTWPSDVKATGWQIEWNGAGGWVTPSGSCTHTVSGLTPNTTYTWRVRATYEDPVCGADVRSGSTTTNQVYHVTYAKGSGTGTCTATGSTTDETGYEAGATVTLQANEFSLSGHTFAGWTEDDDDITISSNQFTMPDHDVVITASWTAKMDKYFDRMHDQTDALHGGVEETEGTNEGKYYIPKEGCNYSIPTAVDRNTGDACQTSHYKLQGWIAASYMKGYPNNMTGEIGTGNEVHIFPPTGTKTATGATYYAIWAEVTE